MGSLSLKFGCHILDCNINTRPIIVFGVELVYIKGGEANFSFRDFEPDFLYQYLLKY